MIHTQNWQEIVEETRRPRAGTGMVGSWHKVTCCAARPNRSRFDVMVVWWSRCRLVAPMERGSHGFVLVFNSTSCHLSCGRNAPSELFICAPAIHHWLAEESRLIHHTIRPIERENHIVRRRCPIGGLLSSADTCLRGSPNSGSTTCARRPQRRNAQPNASGNALGAHPRGAAAHAPHQRSKQSFAKSSPLSTLPNRALAVSVSSLRALAR